MLNRKNLTPDNMYKTGGNNQTLYTPIVVVEDGDHTHIHFAGRTARDSAGDLVGKGDMRAQIRKICENIKLSLDAVGATFQDVVRTVTYTSDMEEYFRHVDERFKYFTSDLPTSTLIEVGRLGWPEMLVEIEAEVIVPAKENGSKFKRHYVWPENMYKTGGNLQILYTPIVVVEGEDHVHVFAAGRTARGSDDVVVGKGDMRAQIRKVCENIKISFDAVGVDFQDITRTVTYVVESHVDEYYRCMEERFKFFTSDDLPTNTLIGVTRLAMPEMLLEIDTQAIIEPERLRIPT